MRQALILCAAGLAALAALAAVGTASAAPVRADAAKPLTTAFSNGREVPSVKALTTDLSLQSGADCAGKAVAGSKTLAQAISQAKAMEDRAGLAAVRAVDKGRDGKPPLAELDASGALAHGNPVGALAALMAAYGKDPKNATILRDLGSILAQLGEPLDALALFDAAGKAGGAIQHPMGISETATESNDRGFALLELRRWAAAKTVLEKAVADSPLLSEAKLNLGIAVLCDAADTAGTKPLAVSAAAGQAAKLIFDGSRRDTYQAFDSFGTDTLVPARVLIDVSEGTAGTWPSVDYPLSMDDIDNDSATFTQFASDTFTTAVDETQQAAALLQSVALPAVGIERVSDLQDMAGDSVTGGWSGEEKDSMAAFTAINDFLNDTFGGDGTAEAELAALQSGGGDPCSVQEPEMRAWLTVQTKTFSADILALDSARRTEWKTVSRWVSGVDANVTAAAYNQAYKLQLDAVKQDYLNQIAVEVRNWDTDAVEFDDMLGDCQDTLGPAHPQSTGSVDNISRCPQALKRASFSLKLEIFSISVTCEKVSVSTSAPGLGPFAKVTINQNGDITIIAGVKAGVSLGPASAGVQAGAYVTIHDGAISDVGITTSAGAGASAGNINLSGPSASATVSFVNASGVGTSFSY